MSEMSTDSDIVEIDGKRYNRTMAKEMARDIELAHSIRPGVWAITENTSLVIGNVALLSFCEPVKHGYLVDTDLVPPDLIHLTAKYGHNPRFQNEPTCKFLKLPNAAMKKHIDRLRYAHEPLVQKYSEGAHTRSRLWKRHDIANFEALVQMVGRSLPTPSYFDSNSSVGNRELLPRAVTLGDARSHFATSGLHYTESQIATFVTALQTKGFVVLSGISGTGKSKIATGFVEMLPAGSITPESNVVDDPDLIPVTVKPYMQKHRRIFVPTRYVDRLPPLDPGTKMNVAISIDQAESTGLLRWVQSGSSGSAYLNLKGDVGQALTTVPQGTALYLRPTILPGTDQVTRIDLLRSEAIPTSNLATAVPADNHLFLSVRPDWRDSTSLLGYYNPLTQTYEWTDFLRFVIRAGENYRGDANERVAWFVILDEMNLAHVEYYFADLLSVLESGRDAVGMTREPLRITYPETLVDEAPPTEVFLPPNLYIIGTVNMDETTHAFSPKVLDRAFTIELTDVDFIDYEIAGSAGNASLSDDEKQALLWAFSRGGKFARIDKAEAAQVVVRHEEIRDHLQSLNDLLRQNRMHFGYRVFDEIAMYLAVNDENGMMPFMAAFDQAVFMKVLPKFTGSIARLRSPLHKVLAWAIEPTRTTTTDVNDAASQVNLFIQGKAEQAWTTTPAFPVVAARVRDMLVTLETDGFVSFG